MKSKPNICLALKVKVGFWVNSATVDILEYHKLENFQIYTDHYNVFHAFKIKSRLKQVSNILVLLSCS